MDRRRRYHRQRTYGLDVDEKTKKRPERQRSLPAYGSRYAGIGWSSHLWYCHLLHRYSIIDPIISLAIAAIILIIDLEPALGQYPAIVRRRTRKHDLKKIQQILSENQYVEGCHHLHVWAISTTENALTAHLILSDILQLESVKQELKERLKEAGIVHATLEFELKSGQRAISECNSQV